MTSYIYSDVFWGEMSGEESELQFYEKSHFWMHAVNLNNTA